jgi:uncharacterized membrane protein YphA (DoxX/SURF4 family)
MNDSMAQPGARFAGLHPLELPGWKTALSWVSAILLAILFLSSGVWKITDAPQWAVRAAQLRIPQSLSLEAAIGFGIAETLGGVLVLTPRFRRWGAILLGILLIGFIGYFAVNYNVLRGADCSCFPWVKRVVGPGFFAADGLMLVLAVLAGLWSRPPGSLRTAVVIFGAVTVFALVSYGVEAVRQTGTKAPASIAVDGKPYSLERGKIFLFFFNPECMHCFEAAKKMSQLQWGDTRVVVIPVEQPQFAAQFLVDTGLRAAVSPDFLQLKQVFAYTGYPFGVALENGREKAPLAQFEGDEPEATLRRLGFIR